MLDGLFECRSRAEQIRDFMIEITETDDHAKIIV